MKTVIIKYNAGNVQSVMYALDRIGAQYEWTDDPDTIRSADKVIFPGVGEASTAMAYLRERELDKLIPSLRQPVLGTCVGMQLMCRYSEENDTTCMGIFDVDVLRFPATKGFKVPQTGWNDIYDLTNPLCQSLHEHDYVYYNHGYYAPLCKQTVAKTNYILEYSAMLQKDNFFAAQFHSEISGNVGQRIFENFLQLS
ncbi:imidazole glycerol phosphate synthase subunit HisH [Runella sp. MFBS21]|uniref:imidazole glycerol phosphate synthase subunit HisH n=1 Tax=Runella sp. MFBS21 TaxID=3034018 RepID=UPI0023FA01DA|nr:imidazole glycerol phosphate synthase subunit HisH [Runella sp. MFBS21]MDF7816097.1 imidazole glycerol phosphate synthase subunit HisH [Runella sp. MFBS21]